MSYLAKKFVLFLGALGVLFGSVFISFRCGYSKGLEDAPRHHYSVDVARALRENPDFRRYVDDVYRSAYIQVLDSVIRKGELMGLIGGWLDEHPNCQIKDEKMLKIDSKSAEHVFFKGVRF